MSNPFHFASPAVLQQQLKLVMGNYRSTVFIIPVVFLLVWGVSNDINHYHLMWWSVAVVSSNLLLQLYGWYQLKYGILPAQLRVKTLGYMALHCVDGALWGTLSWLVLGNITDLQIVFVAAIFSGMLGASLATLSPIPILFLAFVVPHLLGIASKLWLTGDISYKILSASAFCYFFALLGHLANSAKITRSAIEMRFELDSSNARLRAIEKAQTLEQERQRLMQEMHDGLGSSLVSALRVVEKGKMQPGEVAQVLKECIDDLKLAIDSIEPVDDDLLLLLATLRFRLGSRLENTGIRLHWKVEKIPALDWLDPPSSLHVLRILQEALTNIIKHTHASEVTLSTRLDGDYVVVKISDNGVGFNVDASLQNGGRGLSSQLYRAKAIGAQVSWLSDDTATSVTLRLPIKQKPRLS